MTFSARIARILSSRRLPWALAIVAVLVAAPSLSSGLIVDDYVVRAAVTGHNSGPYGVTKLDAFRFIDPTLVPEFVANGVLPWWASPGLRLAFFRPLSSFTHWLDFQLFPGSPLAMHVVSLAWMAAATALATLLYRRLLGAGWVSGLAALFFAMDPGHALSAGWISARNAVLAAFFGLAAVYAHDRWRRDGDRRAQWIAAVMTAASLASAEAGVATLALLAAHVLAFEKPGLKTWARALAPHVAVALVWVVIYRARGSGAAHSWMYADPVAAPADFVTTAVHVFPINVGARLSGPPASFGSVTAQRIAGALAGVSLLFVVLAAITVRPFLRTDPAARFLAAGVVLAALPFSGTLPNDRNLLLVGFAGFGLLALAVRRAVEEGGILLRIYAGWIVLLNLVVAIPGCFANARAMDPFVHLSREPLSRVLLDAAVPTQTAIFVNPPSQFMVSHFTLMREDIGAPTPERMRALVPGIYASRITRPREDQLAIHVEGGILPPPGTWPANPGPAPAINMDYIAQQLNSYARGRGEPMHAGDVFPLPGLRVEVTAVAGDGGPSDMTFTFDRSLDDPSLRWLVWRDRGYEKFPVPRTGEAVDLPPAPMVP